MGEIRWAPTLSEGNVSKLVDVTAEENEAMLGENGYAIIRLKDWLYNHRVAAMCKTDQRDFVDKSRLGIEDYDLIRHATTPERFWGRVIETIGLKKFLDDPIDIIELLAMIRPCQQPETTRVYTKVRNQLATIFAHGQASQWTTTEGMEKLEFPTEAALEVLRLYGDEECGFGTMPSKILKLLGQTGLAWMCVDPQKRELPKFWAVFIHELVNKKKSRSGSGTPRAYGTLKKTIRKTNLPTWTAEMEELMNQEAQDELTAHSHEDPWDINNPDEDSEVSTGNKSPKSKDKYSARAKNRTDQSIQNLEKRQDISARENNSNAGNPEGTEELGQSLAELVHSHLQNDPFKTRITREEARDGLLA